MNVQCKQYLWVDEIIPITSSLAMSGEKLNYNVKNKKSYPSKFITTPQKFSNMIPKVKLLKIFSRASADIISRAS